MQDRWGNGVQTAAGAGSATGYRGGLTGGGGGYTAPGVGSAGSNPGAAPPQQFNPAALMQYMGGQQQMPMQGMYRPSPVPQQGQQFYGGAQQPGLGLNQKPYQGEGQAQPQRTATAGPAAYGQPTNWNQMQQFRQQQPPQMSQQNPFGLPGNGTTGQPAAGQANAGAQGRDPRLEGYGRFNDQTQQFAAPRFGEPGYGGNFTPGQPQAFRQPGGNYSMIGSSNQDAPRPQGASPTQPQQPSQSQSDTAIAAANAAMQNFYKISPQSQPTPYGHRGGPSQTMINQYAAQPNGANLLRYFQNGGASMGPMTVAQSQQYGFR